MDWTICSIPGIDSLRPRSEARHCDNPRCEHHGHRKMQPWLVPLPDLEMPSFGSTELNMKTIDVGSAIWRVGDQDFRLCSMCAAMMEDPLVAEAITEDLLWHRKALKRCN